MDTIKETTKILKIIFNHFSSQILNRVVVKKYHDFRNLERAKSIFYTDYRGACFNKLCYFGCTRKSCMLVLSLSGSGIYIIIFYQYQLYMYTALNVFCVLMAIYGWTTWKKIAILVINQKN